MENKGRSKQRQTIMSILYQFFLFEKKDNKNKLNQFLIDMISEENDFICEMVKGIVEKRCDLDSLANTYLKDWTIDRLGKIDQVILRIGIFELLYTNTPPLVSIDEAIKLAKQYSDEAVRKMINGVLDKIYHKQVKKNG